MKRQLSFTVNFGKFHSGPGNLFVSPVCRQLRSTAGNNAISLIVTTLYRRILNEVIRKVPIEET